MNMRWRTNFALAFIFMFAAAIIGRLVFLQIVNGGFYAALASGQQTSFVNTQGQRGNIYMQGNNMPVATEKTSYYLYLSPNEVPSKDKAGVAQSLSNIVGLSESDLLTSLQKNSLYELVSDPISDSLKAKIESANLEGVHVGSKSVRDYPYGSFASQLLGFVNSNGSGQYGLEQYYNDVLSGKEEYMQGVKGPLGYLFSYSSAQDNAGSDLVLNIDYNIQYMAEKLLKTAATDNLNIKSGTIIVMDPNTGAVLALANYPSFNPNNYSQVTDMSLFQDNAIQGTFEPGSVFKAFTMAAGLNEGVITPDTTYQDPGTVTVGGWPISNYDHRQYPGNITMTEVLEKSINTGAMFAENKVGNQKFLEYVKRFGIFEKTGVDLWGEALSPNTGFKQGYAVNYATAAFGQGIDLTPIQLMRGYAAIANGGTMLQPEVVKEVIDSDGNTVDIKPKVEATGIISKSTAQKLTSMLVSVTENGYAMEAQVPGYYVAGKTGTAQVSYAALGESGTGYSNQTIQSFIGYAPAFNPRFLALVEFNDPETDAAEYSATPVFQELAKYILDYYNVPPDHE